MWNGWQNITAWELPRSDSSVSKITFHNFPSPVLVQIAVCTKDKGRGREGTSECAQLKPLQLLVLCWGCGKGAEVLLLFHLKALEVLRYSHQGFCCCWKQLLLYFKIYFKCFRKFLLAEEVPASQCEWLSPLLSLWLVMSELSYCHSNAGVWGYVAAVSTVCHSSGAASPKLVLLQSCSREGTETLAVCPVCILITYSKSMLFWNQRPFLAFFLEIAFPKTFKKRKKKITEIGFSPKMNKYQNLSESPCVALNT